MNRLIRLVQCPLLKTLGDGSQSSSENAQESRDVNQKSSGVVSGQPRRKRILVRDSGSLGIRNAAKNGKHTRAPGEMRDA